MWPLERFHHFDGEKWIKCETKTGDLRLILQGDYLYITNRNTLIEQVCLSSGKKTSVIFSENTLGFYVLRPQGISKFSVKFSSRCTNIAECLERIQKFIKIQTYNKDQGNQCSSIKTVVENLMQKGPLDYLKGNINMVPENYPVEQITQLCLLDNELPHLVSEIETILHQYSPQGKRKE